MRAALQSAAQVCYLQVGLLTMTTRMESRFITAKQKVYQHGLPLQPLRSALQSPALVWTTPLSLCSVLHRGAILRVVFA